MKKFLLTGLIYAVLFVLFYVAALCVSGTFMPPWMLKNLTIPKYLPYSFVGTKVREALNYGPVDILFVGTSASDYGLDVELLQANGFRVFNWASQRQSPLQTQLILKRYLPLLKPKLVVYEVAITELGKWSVKNESSLNFVYHLPPDLSLLKMILQQRYVQGINTWLFYRFTRLHDPSASMARRIRIMDYVPGGGQRFPVQHFDRVNDRDIYRFVRPLDGEPFMVHPLQHRKLLENIRLIQKHDIPVVFIAAPASPYVKEYISAPNEFDAYMKTLGEYYNFSNIMDLDEYLYFNDPVHLNVIGAELFTEKLIETLKLSERIFPEGHPSRTPGIVRPQKQALKNLKFSSNKFAHPMGELTLLNSSVSNTPSGPRIRLDFTATNTGDAVWQSYTDIQGCITISFYRIVNGKRQEALSRAVFSRDVFPGETIQHTVEYSLPPDFAGEWHLDLIAESYYFFSDRGMPPAILQLNENAQQNPGDR